MTDTSWRIARRTTPLVRPLAGHRLFPLWAVIHHRGRRTGRHLTVPVAITATEESFLIALPWGPTTNWARNVLAAGECVVRWKSRDHHADRPRVLDADEARPYFGRLGRVVAERVIGAESFLLLHR